LEYNKVEGFHRTVGSFWSAMTHSQFEIQVCFLPIRLTIPAYTEVWFPPVIVDFDLRNLPG